MKKIILILICVLLLVGCGNTEGKNQNPETNCESSSTENLKDADTSQEDAKSSDFPFGKADVVCRDGEVESGLDAWYAFFRHTELGFADRIIIREVFTGDPYSSKYCSIPNNTLVAVSELVYDGTKFTMTTIENPSRELSSPNGIVEIPEEDNINKKYVSTYQYLIQRSGNLSGEANFTDTGFYLVNDPDVTYEELMWSQLSSSSYDWIDFKTVLWIYSIKDEVKPKEKITAQKDKDKIILNKFMESK